MLVILKSVVPDSLDEAAEIDGADRFTTYRRIIFSNAEAHACYNLDYQCIMVLE